MTGTEIATRSSSAALIAPALVEAGVKIGEIDGVRVVHFPDDLRERFNVLQPVTALVAADPLWSPSIKLVKLDPGDAKGKGSAHVYPGQRAGTVGLSKHGVTLVADAAGVDVDSTTPIEPRLLKGSQIGWQARLKIRRGDGTFKYVTGSRVMDLEEEREAIEAQVLRSAAYDAGNGNPWPQAKIDARVRERWIKERPHYQAKCETFAVLRAMRLVLQLPHEYAQRDLAKPFLVVGFSMTPDYSDPLVRQMLLEAGATGQASAYGGSPPAEIPSSSWGDESSDELEAQAEPLDDEPIEAQATAPAPVPDPGPQEPEAELEPVAAAVGDVAGDATARRFAEAGRYTVPSGKHRGKAIAAVAAEDHSWLEWLAGRQPTDGTPHATRMLHAMVTTYLELERVS